jgi:hypothetical protein
MKKGIEIICVLLAALFIAGCGHNAGIVKTDIPMSDQCVIDLPGGAFVNTNFFYGDIKLSARDFGSAYNIILPAGQRQLRIERTHTIDLSSSISGNYRVTRYVQFLETWVIDYDFQPGKYYTVNVTEANIEYKGNKFVTNDPVSLRNDSAGFVIAEHRRGEDVEVIEDPQKHMGNTYANFVLKPSINIHVWDYGTSIIPVGFGACPGFQIINGKLNMFIGAEFVFLSGFCLPQGHDPSYLVSGSYGGTIEFNFRPISFGFGGGMASGTDFINSPYNFPYVELDLWTFDKDKLSRNYLWGFFGRYYFNDEDNWANKFTVGYKIRA